MATATQLLTAEQFGNLPDPGHPQELVRGEVTDMPPTKPIHGKVCARIQQLLLNFCDQKDCGHVFGNDAGVVTERNPDTVRGADVAFYSFDRIAKGQLPLTYPAAVPNAVWEVRSPSDRWSQIHRKVAEYLEAGVLSVYVVDPDQRTVQAFYDDAPSSLFNEGDEFVGRGILCELRIPVAKFFS